LFSTILLKVRLISLCSFRTNPQVLSLRVQFSQNEHKICLHEHIQLNPKSFSKSIITRPSQQTITRPSQQTITRPSLQTSLELAQGQAFLEGPALLVHRNNNTAHFGLIPKSRLFWSRSDLLTLLIRDHSSNFVTQSLVIAHLSSPGHSNTPHQSSLNSPSQI
jgi:hypothetical protein